MTSERHGRSLWQVLGIYAAASWVCLQVVDVLAQNIGLPSWVFTLTLGMLVAGLPITAITAYLQGIDRRKDSDSPAGIGLFTWKNLRNGAVAALAGGSGAHDHASENKSDATLTLDDGGKPWALDDDDDW